MALEKYGFTPKQIHTPETVLCMAQEGQPGWTVTTRITQVVCSKDSPDDILVNIGSVRKVDVLRDAWATKGGIASFYVNNGINEFL